MKKNKLVISLSILGVFILSSLIIATAITTSNIQDSREDKLENISTAVIKEANILKKHKAPFGRVILDANNNGILDNGDIFINKVNRLEIAKKSVIYLDDISGHYPLAYSNEKDEYTVLFNPSYYYNPDKNNKSKIDNIDKEFSNFMKNKTVLNLGKVKER
ncbi:MAG: hypothetical protein ACI4N3_03370 [Alphaproteobacteria bacterium]